MSAVRRKFSHVRITRKYCNVMREGGFIPTDEHPALFVPRTQKVKKGLGAEHCSQRPITLESLPDAHAPY